jgi:hypothetical protein
MKPIKVVSHFSDQCLKKIVNSQTEVRALKGWQIIYCAQTHPDKDAQEIGNILCVSRSHVFRVIDLYNKRGKHWLVYGKWGGWLLSLSKYAESNAAICRCLQNNF